MKINKKILIPVFASAMGLSAIGGISGAVAWYQYNTKAEASWVGASVADGGSLLISKDGGTTWDRSIVFGNGSDTLHPCTFPGINPASTSAPTGAKRHPEYGQTSMGDWEAAVVNQDYVQYTFMLKAQRIENNEYVGYDAQVSIKEFVLTTVESGDTAKAVRVHFASSQGGKLYSLDGGSTAQNGKLDLNGDEKADYKAGYSWTEGFGTELTYGSGSYSSTALANDAEFLEVPAAGLEITMTIWLEGWHSFANNDMSMWDPQETGGVTIRFGVTFGIDKADIIND